MKLLILFKKVVLTSTNWYWRVASASEQEQDVFAQSQKDIISRTSVIITYLSYPFCCIMPTKILLGSLENF